MSIEDPHAGDWLPGSARQAKAARWEPWAYWMMWPLFVCDGFLLVEAYHHHLAVWKVTLGVASTLLALEGASIALNYRDAAYKVAGPDPRRWSRTGQDIPWTPPWIRVMGLFVLIAAIALGAKGIMA